MRKTAIAGAVALLVSWAGAPSASAQGTTEFPTRTITIVSPFLPGGMNDVVSRMVAERLGKLGQHAIVENKPGANGTVGAVAVKNAPADGHTMLMGNGATHGTNLALYPNLPYHPIEDFTAVGNVTSSPILLVVKSDSPFNSVADLIKFAKENPGKVTWGTSGTGSTGHLAGEIFKRAAVIDATHVPYRGDTPAVTDVLSGNITMGIITYGSVLGLVQSGTLRVLAKATAKGSTVLPNVPSMEDLGYKGFVFSTWFALVAPANSPKVAVKKINDELRNILRDPAVVSKLATLGAEPNISTPEETETYIKGQVERLGAIVRELNLQAK